MALRVWLPLNGSLENVGVSDAIVTNTNGVIDNNGKIGKCYTFGTGTSYLTIPKEAMTEFSTECSVSFWLKIISWNTNYATFFQAGLGSTAWNNYIFGFLRNNANSTICFTISNGSTASNASYLTSTMELNRWYHVALTYSTGKCSIYLDGVLDHEYTTTIVPAFSSITTITAGICNNKSSYQTNCSMNDLRIYDHCLSAKEVKEIAQGLILHYKLDEIIGNNLLANSFEAAGQSESAYMVKAYNLTENLVNGDAYTITAKLTASSEKKAWGVWVGGGSYIAGSMFQISKTTDIYTKTFTADANMADKTFIQVYVSNNSGTQGSTAVTGTAHIHWIKIEKGSVSTGWGPSDEETSAHVADSSGYGNDGIILNTTPQMTSDTNRYETAVKFHTNTSKIKLPVISYSNFGNSYTISWWEYMTTVSNGPMPWGFSDGNRLNFYHTTNLCWNTGDSGSNPFTPTKTSASLVNNQWHFMAITGDGSATKLYIDGVLHGNATTYKPLTGTQIYISGWDTGTSYTMINNSMNDFRIYATTLSADDIADLYHTSANVDNLQQMHAFEFSENGNATKIYKNGIWETEKIMSSTEGANLFSGSKTTDWRGITAKFDGEYLTLNGTATSALTGNAGSGFYLPITYEAGKQYSFIVSYVSGTATGSGNGVYYSPNGFSSIYINQSNYTTTQYKTRSVSTTTEETTGYSSYGWLTGTTYNNLIMKLQVIEGAYNPDGISSASVYSNKLQAVNFIEK